MSDLFLGLIAAGVVIMAAMQIAAVVFAIRAARQVGEAVNRLHNDVKPIVANLEAMSAQAARASNAAAVQMERAGQLVTDLSRRVDDTAAAVQSSIVGPAREVYALAQGLLAAFPAEAEITPGFTPIEGRAVPELARMSFANLLANAEARNDEQLIADVQCLSLRLGANVWQGELVCEGVAESLGLPWKRIEQVLG